MSRFAARCCPCGAGWGSSRCFCGRALSAVAPRAVGSGAVGVAVAASRRAPSGLVAWCAFGVWASAVSFAQACPGLFGVVSPVVRRRGALWVVSVPVSSWL